MGLMLIRCLRCLVRGWSPRFVLPSLPNTQPLDSKICPAQTNAPAVETVPLENYLRLQKSNYANRLLYVLHIRCGGVSRCLWLTVGSVR